MVNPQSSVGPAKVSLDVRKGLLDALGLPLGSATIARRRKPEGDTLVVRMTAPGLLPVGDRLTSFRGYSVVYEVVRPLEIQR
jgi:hypothetical protein